MRLPLLVCTALFPAALLPFKPVCAAQAAMQLFTLVPPPQRPVQSASVPRPRGPLAIDRVGGRVLSAAGGQPVAGAFISLQDPKTGQTLASTQADADGRFRFDQQPTGKYSVRASAPGYVAAAYQEHGNFSTAIVLGAGLATDALVLTVTPSAVIAGRVLDEAGDPVLHGQITLYRESDTAIVAGDGDATGPGRIQRTRNAQTGDDGSFEFAGVAPGRFYLSASAQPWYAVHPRVEAENTSQPYRSSIDPALDVAYPELFYPSSIDPAAATPIVIKGGEQIAANFVMQPEHAVTLTLRLGPDGPNRNVPQLMRSVFGVTEPVQVQFSGGNGKTLTLSGIPSGRYSLQTFSGNGRQPLPLDEGPVDLTGGSTALDVPAANNRSASVHLSLHTTNGAPLPEHLQCSLRPRQGLRGAGLIQDQVSEKNEVNLPIVPFGDYGLVLSAEGRSVTVTGLSVNGKAVADRHLHVTGEGDLQVDLSVTTYAPTLQGFARNSGKGAAGGMVVLVPAGANAGTDLFRRDQSDLDGSFSLNDVVPGNYLLVAIEDGWKLPRWNDAGALGPYLTRALPVTVGRAGNSTVLLDDPVEMQVLK